LRRELDLYVRAGIPPMRVLRMATYDAAANMRRERTSGSIAPGKDADLVLLDGDPTQRIADLERVDLVVQRGARLLPAELLALVSLRPPSPSPPPPPRPPPPSSSPPHPQND
jgi:imidazolonepropionase-like amidohydrolase